MLFISLGIYKAWILYQWCSMFNQYLLVVISVKSVSSYLNLTLSVFCPQPALEIFFLSLKATWRFLAKEFSFFMFFPLDFPPCTSWMRIFFFWLGLFWVRGRTRLSSSSPLFSSPPSLLPSWLPFKIYFIIC